MSRRLSSGSGPVWLGLAGLAVLFQLLNPNFLTPRNLSNLAQQIAAMGAVSAGLVLVLLLGEIDLSAGAVSGLGAAVMAVLNVRLGVPGPAAVAAGVAAGAAIGLLQGAWITRLAVPSFIVTLAGLLAWQGALLAVLGATGTVNLDDRFILGLTHVFLGPAAAAGLGLLGLGAVALGATLERRRRRAAGLAVPSAGVHALELLLLGGLVAGALVVLCLDRGVPLAVPILLVVLAGFDLVVRRTRFGRHVLAVGGNAEAARRAGIPVRGVRLSVFVLGSALAAFGGVLAASRLLAVNQSSGSGDVLLNAIAAAVIGGTSLFGGRGSVWSVLPGALLIGAIANGMDLLGLAAAVKLLITGAVLLAAVTVDAAARRSRGRGG